NVARNWVTEMIYRKGSWAGVTNPTVTGVHEISQDGVLLARYYDLSPRGYVVVPALKEMGPIRVYSDESNLDENQEGGMLQLLRDVLSERAELYLQVYGDLNATQPGSGDVPFDRSQKTGWARLAVAAKDFRIDQSLGVQAEAGPLTTSSWHQRDPYSNNCPMGDGGRCVVGCTATALSQILNYWKWPSSGIGSHSYTWGGDNCNGGWVPGQILTADFSDSYDWANIPDSCDGTEGCTPEQEAALANLCYEAGVSVNMDYGACASGAAMDMGVFLNYFKYSPSVSREYRVNHTQQSWFDVIKSEIDAGRVMWYHINSHSIVCDGYRDNGGQLEYHMNYGWGQGNNAWYVIDNLYCYWIAGEVCPYEQEDVTIHIEPQYRPYISYVGRTIDDSGDHDGLVEKGEAVAVTITVKNSGNIAANATGTLSTADPFVHVTAPSALFSPSFGWGEQSPSATPFVFEVDAACPDPHVALLELQITADGGYLETQTFPVFIGTRPGWSDDLESGEGFWSHLPIRVAYEDEWHLETSRVYSGSTSWKAGGPGLSNYSDASDGGLLTPPFLLPPNGKLTFWHWMSAETGSSMTAWDGGIVMISSGDGAWTQIFPEGGYPYTIIENTASPFAAGTPCYSGDYDWTQATFDLSAYSGVVQLMFRFGVDGAVNYEGWYIDDVWVGNTIEGENVQLSVLPDFSVTFRLVATPGNTIATIYDTGPLPPSGYAAVPTAPARYYDLSTDAAYFGGVEVCISYDDADVTRDESTLRLLHYVGGAWTDVTTSLDTETNQICGSTTTLSPFLIVERSTCCEGRVGNANGLGTPPNEVTISDIQLLVTAKFISSLPCEQSLHCLTEADVNQSGGADPACKDITIADIQTLVNHLFIAGPTNAPLKSCL
ncbi:MAG: C10 family peptidase, partial [candidate division Zixibacteria bacterium]|nr:C10 family peptidase [candidate division Zixibacteria bacterium]